MAFIVKTVEKEELGLVEEFNYKPHKLKISFRSFETPLFRKAYDKIGDKTRLDMELLKLQPKDATFFDDIEEEKGSTGELVIDAVGRYLIADWDVDNQDGEKLPVTGENFKLLMANIPKIDQVPFLQWCLDCSGDVAIKEAELHEDTKKKPSTATRGKQTTKT